MADYYYDYYDNLFTEPRDLVDFFLWNNWFKTSHKYVANGPGKNGMIFRGQSEAGWDLTASAFRKDALQLFTPQAPTGSFDEEYIRMHLGWHLHTEARAIYIFLESADSMGIPTPLDYSRTKESLELILAAFNDQDYDYSEPFPKPSFQRATALAQHHGVPTRFLDWSESPFVACFFAAYGASSFASKEPKEDQEIAIIFMSTSSLSKADSKVELIKAPRYENSNLLRQLGIFTNIKIANQFFLEHKKWPTMNDVSNSHMQLQRARLPANRADDLLRILFDLNITRHSMMPNLDNAARSYAYSHTLFAKGA